MYIRPFINFICIWRDQFQWLIYVSCFKNVICHSFCRKITTFMSPNQEKMWSQRGSNGRRYVVLVDSTGQPDTLSETLSAMKSLLVKVSPLYLTYEACLIYQLLKYNYINTIFWTPMRFCFMQTLSIEVADKCSVACTNMFMYICMYIWCMYCSN